MKKIKITILNIFVLVLCSCTQMSAHKIKEDRTNPPQSLIQDKPNDTKQGMKEIISATTENQTPLEKPQVITQAKVANLVKNTSSFETIKQEKTTKKEFRKQHKLTTISGDIKLVLTNKDNSVNVGDTIIYFLADNYINNNTSKKTYSITTQNKRFKPNVLVIPVGSTVRFPNQDRILHNVFSVSEIAPFDLGLYAAGNAKQIQFNKVGIAYINCNVHHAMHADILVIDTPFYARLDKNNHFILKNLPTNKGRLYIWHPRANLKEIKINGQSSLQETLEITRAKIPQHLNKFGSPYTKTRK